MKPKREPIGERCTPVRLGNGTYHVRMLRGGGPHRDGEYFGNGSFTVERRPEGDTVRARPEAEEDSGGEPFILRTEVLIAWVYSYTDGVDSSGDINPAGFGFPGELLGFSRLPRFMDTWVTPRQINGPTLDPSGRIKIEGNSLGPEEDYLEFVSWVDDGPGLSIPGEWTSTEAGITYEWRHGIAIRVRTYNR